MTQEPRRDEPTEPDRLYTTEAFRANGQSVAAWARSMNFNARLVYAVLRGERKCLRGQSHEIAKELGLK